jgi:adenylate kinase
MINLILFGAPGSGKGTQAEFIIDKFGLKHISTGDLLRNEIKNETDLGKQAQAIMSQGKLVSDEIVINIIRKFVEANMDSKGFIFDGFPRTIDQANALDTIMADNNTEINSLVMLDVHKEELVQRILNRAKTSGRADDADQSIIENRISVYEKETTPVMDYYNEKGKLQKINGVGTLEAISSDICKHIETL